MMLPEDIVRDIEYGFGYTEEASYQKRAHEYLTTHEILRGFNDTAVQVEVTDIARRAYKAGQLNGTLSLDIQSDLLDVASKCLATVSKMEA